MSDDPEEVKPRSDVIISGPDGVTRPRARRPKRRVETEPPPQGRLQRLAHWWQTVEIQLFWLWVGIAEVGWGILVLADLAQPFTVALHLLWLSPLCFAQAYAVWVFGAWRRQYLHTPPTEVVPIVDAEP